MKIYFIGIGGIGVSALAQYYLTKGHQVFGSDLESSEITDFLKKTGIKIFIGKQKSKNISKDIDLIVYSPAVKKDNPELIKARSYKLKAISYPEALGELTKEFYTIAVAGAHGKSTTTAMIGLVLEAAGLDPTVIVGTKVKEFGGTNFRFGKSKLLVIEACEYDSSFLFYSPKIIVVTNVDKEHLDYFKTFEKVKKAFADFIACLPAKGFLVYNSDDNNLISVVENTFKQQCHSGESQNPESVHKPWIPGQARNDKVRLLRFARNDVEAKKIKSSLKIPGDHNVSNALAVLQVARILAVPDEITINALSKFKGTWRRFEILKASVGGKKIIIISDYAHHPNEIIATLKAAREKYSNKNIICVFQPHQHQRTHYLFEDFVKTFREAVDENLTDKIIITDIYDVAGRETKKINKSVSSEKLVKKINKEGVVYCEIDKLEKELKKNSEEGGIDSGDILIIMGAGDIYKLADKF